MSFTNSHSFVQRTFPPLIGSLTSPSVEQICQKNNVSFAELLRPFCNVYVDYQLKDPSGNDHGIKHLKVGVQDVKELPPDPPVARLLLNEAVASAWCEVTKEVQIGNNMGMKAVDIPVECPWFHAWTETFLRVQFPSEHEFTRHLLGCMLVTSTLDPRETMQNLLEDLKKMQMPAPSKFPKWFCPAIFKFYILLHDARSGDKSAALEFFESIKKAYGADHCYFLEVNSRQPGENGVINHWTDCISRPLTVSESPIPTSDQQLNQFPSGDHPLQQHPLSPNLDNHYSIPVSSDDSGSCNDVDLGNHLSVKDVDSLRELMSRVVRYALLPHVEKQIYIINDLVANKKGMSRSLLSATKRLFGSPRPGGTGGPAGLATGSVVFSPDAAELQLRRLGDLYFIFSSYSNAFQAYYAAKRELGMEQAWLYYAGALEMAALSAFMLPEPSKKAVEYMEEAIMTYLTSCQMPQFATRATLLSYHCLKEREMFSDAAKQLIRMTSEDSDLRSALLLEQAAYCMLKNAKPRKYAFQMVLAGHRYSKAGQRRHALRCVRQSLQIYGGLGWSLAEDHIHSTIGRLAGQLHLQGGAGAQLLDEGLRALSQLLHSRSRQCASQQAAYLLEYLTMHQAWEHEENTQKLAILPLPVVDDNCASVRVVSAALAGLRTELFPVDPPEEAARWITMEELGLAESGRAPMVFRPTCPVLSKGSLNSQGHVLAVNERLEVQICLRNPLQISLPLARLRLLWSWTGLDGRTVDGGDASHEDAVALTEELPSLLLPPQAIHFVTMGVVPRCEGIIQVTGLVCSLTTAGGASGDDSGQLAPVVRGRQDLIVRGPKLRPPKDRPFAECYAEDKRLHAAIVTASPLLTVCGIPSVMEMVCGQMEQIHLELYNAGNMDLKSLYAVIDGADLVGLPPEVTTTAKTAHDAESDSQFKVITLSLATCGGSLRAGARLPFSAWVRAPDVRGVTRVHVLFMYATGVSEDMVRRRVVRANFRLIVSDGLQLSAVANRSPQGDGEVANLCLSASNHHTASVSLTRVVVASRQWSLEGPPLCPSDMTVQPSETSFMVSRARGRRSETENCTVSSLRLSGPESDLNSAASNLLLRRAACQLMVLGLMWETTINEELKHGLSLVGVEMTGPVGIGAALPSVIENRSDSPSRAPRTVTIISPEQLVRPQGMVNSSDAAYISLSLSHTDKVFHDFSESRVCLVDVTVTLASNSSRQLTVEVNPVGADSGVSRSALLRSHVYTPHAAGAFAWTGRTRAKVIVPAWGCATITLRAAVSKPGTYDLAVRLNAAICDTKGVKQLPPPPESPLVVYDATTTS